MSNEEKIVIGIDFGEFYCCVAVSDENQIIHVITDEFGNFRIPNVIVLNEGEILAGQHAKQQMVENLENTFFGLKCLIGKKFEDEEKQKFSHLPFTVFNYRQRIQVEVNHNDEKKRYMPWELVSIFFGYLKGLAEKFLKKKVERCEISVPIYGFDDMSRICLQMAGEKVGMFTSVCNDCYSCVYNIFDPRKVDDTEEQEKVILIQIGASSMCVSAMEVESRFPHLLKYEFDRSVGGRHFTDLLFDYICEKYLMTKNMELKKVLDTESILILKDACDVSKIELSSRTNASISIKNLLPEDNDFVFQVSRSQFETICSPLFRKLVTLIRSCLNNEQVQWKVSDVDHIILEGGSFRIPKLKSIVTDFFGGKKPYEHEKFKSDMLVSVGALLKGHERIKFAPKVFDVNVLSIGVCSAGGTMTELIGRNSTFPAKKRFAVSNTPVSRSENNQVSVLLRFYEGESAFVKNNFVIGEMRLENLPPTTPMYPKIEITMELNADSRKKNREVEFYDMKVFAREVSCGLEVSKDFEFSDFGKEEFSMQVVDDHIRECEEEKDEEKIVENVLEKKILEWYVEEVGKKKEMEEEAVTNCLMGCKKLLALEEVKGSGKYRLKGLELENLVRYELLYNSFTIRREAREIKDRSDESEGEEDGEVDDDLDFD